MRTHRLNVIVYGISLTLLPVLHGQTSSSAPVPEEMPAGLKRFSFGFRVAGYPFNPFHNRDVTINTAGTYPATFTISTVDNYMKVGFGPTVEYALTKKFTLVGELLYHRVNFTETSEISQGSNNTGITENASGNFWDVPFTVRFRGIREEGFLSHVYFSGGGAFRAAASVKTNTVTNNPDGTTTVSYTAIKPAESALAGAVVGSGLRFVDDFGIKVEPELRYTRWFGRTFDSNSTRSSENQVEVDVAFTF